MFKRKEDTLLRVQEPCQLLDFLMQKMGGMTKTSIKQLLGQRRVQVNGGVVTRHDSPLRKDDTVVVLNGRGNKELLHPKLRIVHEDDHLIVVEKQPGLLTVPSHPGGTETTVQSLLLHYVKRQSQRAGIWTVHRLDRETSGVLVFARTQELQMYMREWWRQLVTKRTYIAVAEGAFDKTEGQIVSWFTEDKRNAMVYSSPVDDGGQKAVTNYRVLSQSRPDEEGRVLSLVELHLETGRTNQIRVHLASIGHPILGDRKYGHGNQYSPADRLCLHARELEFVHPVTEQKVLFDSPVPKVFYSLTRA